MNDRDVDALIQEVLDGDASPERLARLREAVARDPSARARRDELEALFRTLRAVPLEDPPADLRDRVMAALRARGAGDARRHARRERPWWGGLRLAIPLAAAVAGLAIVAAYLTWPPGSRDDDGVGAMAPAAGRETEARMFTDELRSGGVTARLSVSRDGGRLRLRVRASKAAGAEAAILFDPGEFHAEPTGFRDGGAGRLVLALGAAPTSGSVLFEPIGTPRAPVRVRLTTPSGTAQTEIGVDPASPGP